MLSRTPGHVRKDRRGVAAVELALLLPFLAFLFVIALDYARAFYYAIALESCARNGAYYASNSVSLFQYSSVNDAILQDAGDLNPPPDPNKDITVLYSATPGGPYTSTTPIPNGYVQVTVNYQFTSVTNFPGLPATVDMTRSVEMQMCPLLPN
jgi:Flp pilus assembly protein TadG